MRTSNDHPFLDRTRGEPHPRRDRGILPRDRRPGAARAALAAALGAATLSAAGAAAPEPCPAREIGVADGRVEIAHYVDRKADYHTVFSCTDLAAGDWKAVGPSLETAALEYDVCSNGLARVPAADGAPQRFFRVASSYAPFAEGDALPVAPVRGDLDVPLSKITPQNDCTFDAATGVLTLPKPNQSSQIWFGNYKWNEPVDATDYEWLVVEKHDATDTFCVRLYYNDPDGTDGAIQATLRCERHRDRCYLKLDPRYKQSVRMIQFQAVSNAWNYVADDTVATLDKIYFTQTRPIVPVVDEGPAVPFADGLSAADLAKAMKVGWNLGG